MYAEHKKYLLTAAGRCDTSQFPIDSILFWHLFKIISFIHIFTGLFLFWTMLAQTMAKFKFLKVEDENEIARE